MRGSELLWHSRLLLNRMRAPINEYEIADQPSGLLLSLVSYFLMISSRMNTNNLLQQLDIKIGPCLVAL